MCEFYFENQNQKRFNMEIKLDDNSFYARVGNNKMTITSECITFINFNNR